MSKRHIATVRRTGERPIRYFYDTTYPWRDADAPGGRLTTASDYNLRPGDDPTDTSNYESIAEAQATVQRLHPHDDIHWVIDPSHWEAKPGRPRKYDKDDATLWVRLDAGLKAWCQKQADADERPLSVWVRLQLVRLRQRSTKTK